MRRLSASLRRPPSAHRSRLSAAPARSPPALSAALQARLTRSALSCGQSRALHPAALCGGRSERARPSYAIMRASCGSWRRSFRQRVRTVELDRDLLEPSSAPRSPLVGEAAAQDPERTMELTPPSALGVAVGWIVLLQRRMKLMERTGSPGRHESARSVDRGNFARQRLRKEAGPRPRQGQSWRPLLLGDAQR